MADKRNTTSDNLYSAVMALEALKNRPQETPPQLFTKGQAEAIQAGIAEALQELTKTWTK